MCLVSTNKGVNYLRRHLPVRSEHIWWAWFPNKGTTPSGSSSNVPSTFRIRSLLLHFHMSHKRFDKFHLGTLITECLRLKNVCFYPLMQAQHYLLYHLHSFGLFRTECTELHHRQSMNGLISRKDFTSYKKIKLN